MAKAHVGQDSIDFPVTSSRHCANYDWGCWGRRASLGSVFLVMAFLFFFFFLFFWGTLVHIPRYEEIIRVLNIPRQRALVYDLGREPTRYGLEVVTFLESAESSQPKYTVECLIFVHHSQDSQWVRGSVPISHPDVKYSISGACYRLVQQFGRCRMLVHEVQYTQNVIPKGRPRYCNRFSSQQHNPPQAPTSQWRRRLGSRLAGLGLTSSRLTGSCL